MQTLYTLTSLDQGGQRNYTAAGAILDNKLAQVLDLFTTTVLYTVRIAEYADFDARQKASRYLATADGQNTDVRIATNTVVSAINNNKSFTDRVKNNKLDKYIDEDLVKKVFHNVLKSAEYSVYTHSKEHSTVADKAIMQYIWENEVFGKEDIVDSFTDELPGWEDDAEMITMLMENYLKGNSKVDFSRLLSGEKKDYAHDLLKAVMDKEEYCMELITPKLVNWDKERVAIIDKLLLRMGVCEFLYFPTIPTKVTINEYIDIAKQYSTPQSGQFVNGVLDNILKDLVKQDMINKTDRNKKG
jgi:N utilization substance protein B